VAVASLGRPPPGELVEPAVLAQPRQIAPQGLLPSFLKSEVVVAGLGMALGRPKAEPYSEQSEPNPPPWVGCRLGGL